MFKEECMHFDQTHTKADGNFITAWPEHFLKNALPLKLISPFFGIDIAAVLSV